jgi:pilus assembly protein CpaE
VAPILVLDRSDDLADQVRACAAALDPVPAIVAWNRLGSVGDLLVREGPFSVVVAGPSLATRSGLRRLAVLQEDMPGAAVVLAFSRRPDCSLREIVQTGAVDLLQVPVDDLELASALRRALTIADRRAAPGQMTDAGAMAPRSATGPARVFTVSSASGGSGKTFYATNMALFLARYTRKRVALVDLDLQFGEVTTALRLRPKYTVFDALRRDEQEEHQELTTHIEEFLVPHDTGFSVLAAPKDPAEADGISAPEITRVIEVLRGRFDYVVIDTPASLNETVLAAFDLSEHVVVLGTLDLPSVRNMNVFLQTVEKLRIPPEHISLVINKAEQDVGIDVAQVAKLFPQGFRSVLPYAREVSRSINVGVPVLSSDPDAEISRLLFAGLVEFIPEGERFLATAALTANGASASGRQGGGLSLFRRRRAS